MVHVCAAVQHTAEAAQDVRSSSFDCCRMRNARRDSLRQSASTGLAAGCLHLGLEACSTGACAAVIARVPMLPPLGTIVCGRIQRCQHLHQCTDAR